MNKCLPISALIIVSFYAAAQQQTISPDLSRVEVFQAVNRLVSVNRIDNKAVVHLNAREGDGVAWIKGLQFGKGIIEFDIKGKNLLQQSFVGIAIHGVNDTTYDVVYFRPFNFNSPDTIRKTHSVQYISLPKYDWSFLRQNFPRKYEHGLTSAIDGDSWFHARLVVDADKIEVFVNKDEKPCLAVKPLCNQTNGNIGFWVGNNSEGNFANLVLKK